MLKPAGFMGLGGMASLRFSEVNFEGSGWLLIAAVALLCFTFLLALHWLTRRTDLTAILIAAVTRKKPSTTSEPEDATAPP